MELPQTFTGKVVKGFGRGSKMLGYATANLDGVVFDFNFSEDFYGVYCGTCKIEDGELMNCFLSIGKNLTFDVPYPTFEVHIFDFDEDIYDKTITVNVIYHIRPMVQFHSVQELIDQLARDKATSLKLMGIEK